MRQPPTRRWSRPWARLAGRRTPRRRWEPPARAAPSRAPPRRSPRRWERRRSALGPCRRPRHPEDHRNPPHRSRRRPCPRPPAPAPFLPAAYWLSSPTLDLRMPRRVPRERWAPAPADPRRPHRSRRRPRTRRTCRSPGSPPAAADRAFSVRACVTLKLAWLFENQQTKQSKANASASAKLVL